MTALTDTRGLAGALRTLKLSGMLATIDARLAQARAGELGHLEFLQVLCEDEISRRSGTAIGRRVRRARFEEQATFEGFDFTASPGIPSAQIRDLAALRWLAAGESVILTGPVSAGKTFIAQARRQHSDGNVWIVGFYKYLLIPQLIWYGVRSPRDQGLAWDRFWASIQRTGADGEVIWDAASTEELDRVRAHALEHMARDLPIVDIGCGNGRFSRLLAGSFPKVLGIDISAHAVRRAEEESGEADNITYRVLDASAAGAGQKLFEELGEANVFMRGVFHVFDAGQRERAVANLRDIAGRRGAVYFAETNYAGDPLDQLVAQGATATAMPEPLRKCVAAGIKPPRHFGEAQLAALFPPAYWETLKSGPMTMHGVPLTTKGDFEPIPSFYAIVRQSAPGSVRT